MRTIGTYTCDTCARPFTADRPAITCSARCRQRRYIEHSAADAVRAVVASLVHRLDTGETTTAVVADLRRIATWPVAAIVADIRNAP